MTALDGRRPPTDASRPCPRPYRLHTGLGRALARVAAFLFAGARECGGCHYFIVPLWKETHSGRTEPLREPPDGHPERLLPHTAPDVTEARIWADLEGIWR
jgi:hypothetical protein